MYLLIEHYEYEGDSLICVVDNIESAKRMKEFYLHDDKNADIDIIELEPNFKITGDMFPYSVVFYRDGSINASAYKLTVGEDISIEIEDLRGTKFSFCNFIVTLWAENTEQAIMKAKLALEGIYDFDLF